jgi:alpha-glucosidase
MHEAVRKAAEHHLVLDIHDEYRPTGYSRTYPNLLTQEGIGGDETSPPAEQTLTLAFTRMLPGAADSTFCYYNPRVEKIANHAYQLAKTVVLYSALQTLYWYDRPGTPGQHRSGMDGVTGDEPELEFWDAVPTVWDETRTLDGSIGEYAAVARRSGAEWYIGAMTAEVAKTFDVKLDMLPKGRRYLAKIYRHDPQVPTRTHVRIESREVTAGDVLKITLTARDGEAIRLSPAEDHAGSAQR